MTMTSEVTSEAKRAFSTTTATCASGRWTT